MILPGGTIGILGGGQLGRMTIQAGRRLGYKFHVFDPSPSACAAPAADKHWQSPYEDRAALEAFAKEVDVVTLEFENIPASAVEALECILPVRPGSSCLRVCQDRTREKNFLKDNGIPTAAFQTVSSLKELQNAVEGIGTPAVVKTATDGYDGKGQFKIRNIDECEEAWDALKTTRAMVEQWVNFRGEFSVICARNRMGNFSVFPVAENVHTNHILDFTVAPARISSAVKLKAEEIALNIAEALDLVGLLTVELFLTHKEEWLVNELAPRPHNSGHYSIDGCITTQFEQHVRAICDLPLGDTTNTRPCAMVNILGDAWQNGEPDWNFLLTDGTAKLHIYDKGEPRSGRKMGHMTFLGESSDDALARALQAREWLAAQVFA